MPAFQYSTSRDLLSLLTHTLTHTRTHTQTHTHTQTITLINTSNENMGRLPVL